LDPDGHKPSLKLRSKRNIKRPRRLESLARTVESNPPGYRAKAAVGTSDLIREVKEELGKKCQQISETSQKGSRGGKTNNSKNRNFRGARIRGRTGQFLGGGKKERARERGLCSRWGAGLLGEKRKGGGDQTNVFASNGEGRKCRETRGNLSWNWKGKRELVPKKERLTVMSQTQGDLKMKNGE